MSSLGDAASSSLPATLDAGAASSPPLPSTSVDAGVSGPPSTPGTPSSSNSLAIQTGRVVDTLGRPLSGAVIYNSVPHQGEQPQRATSDAEGNYQLRNLIPGYPYKAYAWLELPYHDQKFCLRIAPEADSGDGNYLAGQGASCNFHWQLQGRMADSTADPDEDGAWYGGSIRLFPYFDESSSSQVELTLVPSEPLIDGSQGSTLTRTVDLKQTLFALDIPLGVYTLSAVRVLPDGSRAPLQVGHSSSELSASMSFSFKAPTTTLPCGAASSSSGIERGFVYLQ